MKQIIIICLSILMISSSSLNNVTDYKENKIEVNNSDSKVGIPIHKVIAETSSLTLQDYSKDYREYLDLTVGGVFDIDRYRPKYGPTYIKPDNTLWNYIKDSYSQNNQEILFEKLGDDIISVYANKGESGETILKLKTDGSLWIKEYGYTELKEVSRYIKDEYGFEKLEDNVMMIADVGINSIYILKKDNTLCEIVYDDDSIKLLDDIAYISMRFDYSTLIKTDGSLWQCEGYNFNKLEKVTDDAIYADSSDNYAFVVKKDKSIYFWDCENRSKELIKIDDNVEYAKMSSRLTTLKTDGSLWYYYFDRKTLDKNSVLKAKLTDNVQALLNSLLFKDKNNKLVRIHDKNENTNPAQATLEVIEGYDIKTPELYDITKPFK